MEKRETKTRFIYYIFFFLISFIGGYYEVYSLLNFNFFAFMHTGNLINSILGIFNENFLSIVPCLISLISFIVFVFLFTLLKKIFLKYKKDFHLFTLILLVILNILLIVIPLKEMSDYLFNSINIVILTLLGVDILFAFTHISTISFVPTMMTNNMRQVASNFLEGIYEHNKEKDKKGLLYLFVVISFVIGVIVSILINRLFKNFTQLNIDNNYFYNQNLTILLPLLIEIVLLFIYPYEKEELD